MIEGVEMVPQDTFALSECAFVFFLPKSRENPHQYCVCCEFVGVDHGQFIHVI